MLTAILRARKTHDGLVEMKDDVPLGKTYIVLEPGVVLMHGRNLDRGMDWVRPVFWTLEEAPTSDRRWIPAELCEFQCGCSAGNVTTH